MITKILTAIGAFFARMFSRDFASKLLAGIEAAAPYLSLAYGFVETAAKMTANRTDDEILALAKEFGVPALLDSDADKGVVIGRIVFQALKKRYPDAADRALNRAIEIAYGAVRP